MNDDALSEATSQSAPPYITADTRLAAQDLLHTLFSSMGGRAIRSEDEVFQALGIPMRRRKEFSNFIANDRGVSQPTSRGFGYTVEEWHAWYSATPLSEYDMDEAVRQWKNDFAMKAHNRHKINFYS